METSKKRVEVLDATMAYLDVGEGPPTVFIHGNPTSSFLWRKVIPKVSGRRIAPDLIGMGDSDKINSSYRLVDHRRYLDAFLDALGLDNDLVLVLHDWGGPLGFDWSARHPDSIAGLAFAETIVTPLESWEAWPEASRALFQAMRSRDEIVLEKNVFVERILPASVIEPLAPETMDEYRRPFLEPGEGRRPTLTWPREIPVGGEPEDVCRIVSDYRDWLATSPIPKLFIDVKPGFLSGVMREVCPSWSNTETVEVAGIHFFQEDSGEEAGMLIDSWLRNLR